MKRDWSEEERKAALSVITGSEQQTIVEMQCENTFLAEQVKEAREVIAELVAQVRGECPSLLNEDSGGDAQLSLSIDTWMSRNHEGY